MQQRTGSVYLDAPLRPSRAPVKTRRRSRAGVADLCVGIGLVALTIAALVAGVRLLVLDPDPLVAAIDDTLDDPAVVEEFQAEVAAGIEDSLVGEELTEIAAAFELDVADEASLVAAVAVDDPTVRRELRNLALAAHERVFVDGDASAVDLRPLTDAVLVVIEQNSPRLASIIPPDTTLWAIDGEAFPDLSGPADLSGRVQRDALLTSLLILVGLIVHPRRHHVGAWIGRWALGIGLVGAVAAVGLPYLAGTVTGLHAAELATRALTLRLLAPAAAVGIAGMGLVSLAAVISHREKRRVADEGAAAAFGVDEPAPWQQPTSPTIDLPARGLVDVNRPLTNI